MSLALGENVENKICLNKKNMYFKIQNKREAKKTKGKALRKDLNRK
jgi:hypothetical protein